tara:strand:+ start:3392 stop:4321 length:930 start_codon:yes stop_codon:yes gene_type:complete
MKKYLKILFLFVFTFLVITSHSQTEYCPEMQLLLQKYKQKEYLGAKSYLDTVLKKCPDRNEDAYFWHISAFINLNIFKQVDNKSPISKSREIAVSSFLNSKKFDNKEKFADHNFQALNYLGNTYYNDAILILQNMDTLHFEEIKNFYKKYKDIHYIISPDSNFNQKEIEINYGLGMLYKAKYENNKRRYRNYMDSSISCFNRAISLNADHYSSNYNLGIIYHNLGVDIILDDLEIDADLEKVIIMQEKAIGYFSKALPYLKKVYTMEPTDKAIVQGIAAVYYSLNDMEKHVEFMNVLKDLEKPSNSNNK